MKMLDIKNHHDRDDKLFFDGETHTYMVDEIIFSSVTTLINNLFEEFDKKKSIEFMMKGKNWETHEFYGKTVEEIESIWTIRNKKAMDEGVKLHEDIEKFLNNITVENTTIEFQYFLNFYNQHLLHVYRTEWKIFDENLKLAGTIDMCSKNSDGTLNVYDWKRSKSIRRFNNYKFSTLEGVKHLMDTNFNHYALQLNLYKYILESQYRFRVRNMYIVCLHPENKNNDYLVYSVPKLEKEIEIIINYIKNK